MYPTGKSEEVRTDVLTYIHHQSPYITLLCVYSLEQDLVLMSCISL